MTPRRVENDVGILRDQVLHQPFRWGQQLVFLAGAEHACSRQFRLRRARGTRLVGVRCRLGCLRCVVLIRIELIGIQWPIVEQMIFLDLLPDARYGVLTERGVFLDLVPNTLPFRLLALVCRIITDVVDRLPQTFPCKPCKLTAFVAARRRVLIVQLSHNVL